MGDANHRSPAQKVPILIVGSGSAGVCAAAYLARCRIPCKILEARSGPLETGQADGVQCRTVEVFESYGIAEELLREAYHVLEVTFWSPADSDGVNGVNGKNGRGITRTGRTADTEGGLSHMPHVILNQARVNGLLIEAMRKFNGQEVDYGYAVKSVDVDIDAAMDQDAYPVTVVTEKDGREEVFEAKYVLVSLALHHIQICWFLTDCDRAVMGHTVRCGAHWASKWSATAPTRSGA